jgi:polyisoprenoid-binding protein YceI
MQSSKQSASRNPLYIVGGVVVLGLVALAVIFVYIWFAGAPSQSNGPVSAPTIDASTANVFKIVPEQSEVRFTLTEDLMGTHTTVIGTTKDVAGDIAVDLATPANSKIGTLRINAGTLKTDNEFRNRAIRGQILQSNDPKYEFIEFTPTQVEGLPAAVKVGDALTFKVTGDLKVRDITQSVTFDVTATVTSDTQVTGKASATVTRDQYKLQIPNAPGVANVSDDVLLEIDFVATKDA